MRVSIVFHLPGRKRRTYCGTQTRELSGVSTSVVNAQQACISLRACGAPLPTWLKLSFLASCVQDFSSFSNIFVNLRIHTAGGAAAVSAQACRGR